MRKKDSPSPVFWCQKEVLSVYRSNGSRRWRASATFRPRDDEDGARVRRTALAHPHAQGSRVTQLCLLLVLQYGCQTLPTVAGPAGSAVHTLAATLPITSPRGSVEQQEEHRQENLGFHS